MTLLGIYIPKEQLTLEYLLLKQNIHEWNMLVMNRMQPMVQYLFVFNCNQQLKHSVEDILNEHRVFLPQEQQHLDVAFLTAKQKDTADAILNTLNSSKPECQCTVLIGFAGNF